MCIEGAGSRKHLHLLAASRVTALQEPRNGSGIVGASDGESGCHAEPSRNGVDELRSDYNADVPHLIGSSRKQKCDVGALPFNCRILHSGDSHGGSLFILSLDYEITDLVNCDVERKMDADPVKDFVQGDLVQLEAGIYLLVQV
jgi:hypothetical protein